MWRLLREVDDKDFTSDDAYETLTQYKTHISNDAINISYHMDSFMEHTDMIETTHNIRKAIKQIESDIHSFTEEIKRTLI